MIITMDTNVLFAGLYSKNGASYQGVSLNQLTNYLLNLQLTQIESISVLEDRLSKKSIRILKSKVKKILEKVPDSPPLPYDNLN